jgi:hypothetical protein
VVHERHIGKIGLVVTHKQNPFLREFLQDVHPGNNRFIGPNESRPGEESHKGNQQMFDKNPLPENVFQLLTFKNSG